MGNSLVPVPGRQVGSLEERALEAAGYFVTSKQEIKRPFRVTEMFYSRYGILGYVELQPREWGEVGVMGVVEVPGTLMEIINRVPGMLQDIMENVFRDGGREGGGKERIDHPSLKGAELFDTSYYWYPPSGGSYYSPPQGAGAIIVQKGEVLDFLERFDKELDKYLSPDMRPTIENPLIPNKHPMIGRG